MLQDMGGPDDLRPWLDRLGALPGVSMAKVHRQRRVARDDAEPGATLTFKASGHIQRYQLEVRRAHPLNLALVAMPAPERPAPRPLLFAQHIPEPLGSRLRDRDIDYVDLAGNCHLTGSQMLVHVEGRRLGRDEQLPRQRQREAGHQLLFALAARPELAAAPVRELARWAGVGKSAAAAMLERLVTSGTVAATTSGRRVLRRDQLIDRFTSAYLDHLRPRWLIGRYRPRERDLPVLEAAIAHTLGESGWAFGGAAAGHRLDPHYRGDQTVVHLTEPRPDFARQIHALPDQHGPLAVIRTPMPMAFDGPVKGAVHPLLVYAELLAAGDERAEEAAARLRERYLQGAP